jgi:hypothetical protein
MLQFEEHGIDVQARAARNQIAWFKKSEPGSSARYDN